MDGRLPWNCHPVRVGRSARRISSIGAEGFGTLEALVAITAAIIVLQASVSGTILWRSSACYGAGDPQGTRRTVQIGITVSLSGVALLVPLAYGLRFKVLELLQLPSSEFATLGWLVPAIVLVTLLGGVNQCLLSVVSGHQRSGIAALVQSVGIATTNLALVIFVVLGAGIASVFYAATAGFLVTLTLAIPLAFRCCDCISLCPTVPNIEEVRRLAPYAGLLLLSSMSVVFRDQLDKVLLTCLTSPGVTAHFSIAQRLSGLVMQVCAVLFVPMTAAFAAANAAGNWHAVTSNFLKWSKWMSLLTGAATVIVITLRSSLLVLWLGQDRPHAHVFVGILILATGTSVIFSGPGVALAKGLGMPGLETRYAMLTLAIILVLKPLFCLWLGPTFAVAASAISWTVGAAYFLRLLYGQIDLPAAGWTNTWSIWAVTLVTSGLGWWLGQLPWCCPTNRWHAACIVIFVAPLIAIVFALLSLAIGRSRAVFARPSSVPSYEPHFLRRIDHENATPQLRT